MFEGGKTKNVMIKLHENSVCTLWVDLQLVKTIRLDKGTKVVEHENGVAFSIIEEFENEGDVDYKFESIDSKSKVKSWVESLSSAIQKASPRVTS